jgi:hypothetical protein
MLRLVAILGLFTVCVPALAGCGHGDAQGGDLQTNELLELLEEQEMRHDSHSFAEVDLGKFKVTHALKGDDGQHLQVRFHLVGILPEQRHAKLTGVLPHYENRMRDAVIHLVQQTDAEQLTDPGLAYFRSEVVAAINRVLQERLLKDVVFSDFSVDRG